MKECSVWSRLQAPHETLKLGVLGSSWCILALAECAV